MSEVNDLPVIYVDRVWILNAVIDYLLLLTTAQLIGATRHRWRLGAAALLGGGYAVAVFAIPVLQAIPFRILVGILLPIISFAGQKRLWRHAALFFLLSGALAGLLLAMGLFVGSQNRLFQQIYTANISWWVLIGSAIFFYLLLELLFRQQARFGKGEIMEITVSLGGKICRVRALYDTGNTLRNPVDGSSVLITEADAIKEILDRQTWQILSEALPPEETLANLYQIGDTSFSLLPFHSVGTDRGLLLVVRSDYIQIGRRICPKTLVALYPRSIGGTAYQALWGGKGRRENAIAQTDSELDPTAQVG